MAKGASKRRNQGASRRKAKSASRRKASTPPRGYTESVKIPPIVELLQRDMLDSWRHDDQLLDRFFSLRSITDSQYQKIQKSLFNKRTSRWKGIPATPKSLSPLYRPLVNLLNDVLHHCGIGRDKRLFFNTHIRRRSASNAMEVLPSIFLAGVGPEFANSSDTRPLPAFDLGISPIEVSLDSADLTAARDRLAVHMFEMFRRQVNRRFAFGLIISQHNCTVYMFDHSGAVASNSYNYHTEPDRFCAVVAGLASEMQQIGVDTSILASGSTTILRTQEHGGDDSTETEYVITEGLFKFPSLVGRGTICWLASRREDGSVFVIKDAWISPSKLAGKEPEAALLRHIQSRGLAAGVVQIHHSEEVRRSSDPSDLDTVLRNRGIEDASLEDMKVERVHTRIVMTPYGKTFDQFTTRKELLFAFYDAVLAHRRLYDVAGILHRDISVRNILINPDGVEGDRGILIDFDHSIRVGDTSPYSKETKIGTWRFMSRAVLKEQRHTYIDDLESFYYVLCWVLSSFESAGTPKTELPEPLSFWDLPDSDQLKGAHIGCAFKLPVSYWFGDSIHDLAVDLHDFFQSRYIGPLARVPLDPAKDYDEFLSYIRLTVSQLEKDDLEVVKRPASDLEESAGQKRKHTDADNEHSGLTPAPIRPRLLPNAQTQPRPRH